MGFWNKAAKVGLIVVLAVGFGACGKKKAADTTASDTTTAASGSGATALVAKDFEFSPLEFTAKAGASVEVSVKNNGSVEHNFTLTEAKAEKDIEKGESASVTFTAPAAGDYEFFCKYHKSSGMKGTLHVTA